jgi:hypothetical protein
MEKIFQANGIRKQTELGIFMSDKPKLIRRDNKEGQLILIKGENTSGQYNCYKHVLYVGTLNFIKQILLDI